MPQPNFPTRVFTSWFSRPLKRLVLVTALGARSIASCIRAPGKLWYVLRQMHSNSNSPACYELWSLKAICNKLSYTTTFNFKWHRDLIDCITLFCDHLRVRVNVCDKIPFDLFLCNEHSLQEKVCYSQSCINHFWHHVPFTARSD